MESTEIVNFALRRVEPFLFTSYFMPVFYLILLYLLPAEIVMFISGIHYSQGIAEIRTP